jgi:putative DNA methylase
LGGSGYLGLFVGENIAASATQGTAVQSSAIHQPMPDDSAQAICTDPPYYDAIAYGDLSDFFYVWLRRILADVHPSLFSARVTNKDEEIVQLSKRFPGPYRHKTQEFFESMMTKALLDSRRIVQSAGIGVVVFAHKSTAGWEAMLRSLIDADWIVTGSWTIDTERGGRLNSNKTASLASSVQIVCRPRESPDGSVRKDEVGDWRDVLQELPRRIHEWMPRLAEEGVVGADAIFACLGLRAHAQTFHSE